jgi:hypothetical protein
VTKIKNYAGFMRVYRILKVWFFIESKKNIFIKICGTKRSHDPNTCGTSHVMQKFTEKFKIIGKPAS